MSASCSNWKDLFALMDSISLPVGIDGQVPSDKTTDLPSHALRGDWGSAEHVEDIRKVLYAMVVLPGGVEMLQGIGEYMAKERNLSFDMVFLFQ